MGKECGAWVSRRLWGGGNTILLKTTAWEANCEPQRKCPWTYYLPSKFHCHNFIILSELLREGGIHPPCLIVPLRDKKV